MAGVGAAFSEIGTLAFASLPANIQNAIVTNLFDVKNGAGFSLCRLPIGSSDFATSAYSYAETAEDYQMNGFSLARDEKSIIPMVNKALKVNPKLSLFASPWSPPAWMKKSGKMDGGGNDSRLRDEENIYKAYALYFEKYLLGYKKLGIPIARLCPQNEMDLSPKYPGCLMEPAEIVKFITQYLAPQFKNSKIATEIWPGTFREKPKAPYAKECMKDEAFRKVITGLGIQYFNPKSIDSLVQIYPQLRLMHTEAICYNAKNDVDQAQKRYSEILGIFNSGCDTFCYWNMLLDENQKNGWNWAQNSLLTINRASHEIIYNPDYQPVYIVSKFVKPGSVRVEAKFKALNDSKFSTFVSAFINKNKSITVLAQNINEMPMPIDLNIDGKVIRIELPAFADCVVFCK
jgi:glucosylceramidase